MRPRRSIKLTLPQRRLRYASRKAVVAAIAAVVLIGLVACDRMGLFGRQQESDPVKYDGKSFKVARVVDGDTLDVDIPDGRHQHTRIRLWGVDTPETVKPGLVKPDHFGPEASEFAKKAASGQTVKLELEPGRETRDKYGRLLAYVILPDGRMLNKVLIDEGYGYADPGFEHHLKGEFARAERDARKNRRGLWKDVRNEDLPDYHPAKLKDPNAAGRG